MLPRLCWAVWTVLRSRKISIVEELLTVVDFGTNIFRQTQHSDQEKDGQIVLLSHFFSPPELMCLKLWTKPHNFDWLLKLSVQKLVQRRCYRRPFCWMEGDNRILHFRLFQDWLLRFLIVFFFFLPSLDESAPKQVSRVSAGNIIYASSCRKLNLESIFLGSNLIMDQDDDDTHRVL